MLKKRLLIIAAVGAAAVVLDIWICTNVLQRFVGGVRASLMRQTPLESIRASLRQQTPVGTSSSEAHTLIDKEGWRFLTKSEIIYGPGFTGKPGTYSTSMGRSCIAADLGYYRLNGDYRLMDVRAMWEFDPSNRLEAIDVWAQ